MGTSLVVISFLGVIVSVCGLAAAFVVRRGRRKWILSLAGCFAVMVVASAFTVPSAAVAVAPDVAAVASTDAPRSVAIDLVRRRCAEDKNTTDALSDRQVYDLAACLDERGVPASTTSPLYRLLAHRIGTSRNDSVLDRDAFTRTWLRVAEVNAREGDLSGAKSAIDTAAPASFGTRYKAELVALSDSVAPRIVARNDAEQAEAQAQADAAAQAAQTSDPGDSSPDDSTQSSTDTTADTSSDGSSTDPSTGADAPADASSDTSSDSSGPEQFDSESAASAHCPSDTVVWLNLNSGIYHFAGERWYGNTRNGAYVCEQEADTAGDRATENGQ